MNQSVGLRDKRLGLAASRKNIASCCIQNVYIDMFALCNLDRSLSRLEFMNLSLCVFVQNDISPSVASCASRSTNRKQKDRALAVVTEVMWEDAGMKAFWSVTIGLRHCSVTQKASHQSDMLQRSPTAESEISWNGKCSVEFSWNGYARRENESIGRESFSRIDLF